MKVLIEHQFFGFIVCVLAFRIGVFISQRVKTPVANPLLLAMIIIIGFLMITGISVDQFQVGGSLVNMLLSPATAILALSIYRQRQILKEYFLPIVIGCFAGSLTSMGSVYVLCRLFHLDEKMSASLIPKSVTTPIAMKVAESIGGISSITVAAVVITGIVGAIVAPVLIRIFRVKNPVAAGVAIGTCSHAMGTTKAIEIGEIEGAMSSVAIGTSGLITVLISLLLV